MLSQFVSTIKETSLGYVISVNELTFAANQINNTAADQAVPGVRDPGVDLLRAVLHADAGATALERSIEAKRAGPRASRAGVAGRGGRSSRWLAEP